MLPKTQCWQASHCTDNAVQFRNRIVLSSLRFDCETLRNIPQDISVQLGASQKMKLVLIPPGEFMMGSPKSDGDADGDERPQHKVRITRPFYLSETEVTQDQYASLMDTQPWSGKSFVKEGHGYAASYISWDDAVKFCQKLSRKESKTYRLPTKPSGNMPVEQGQRRFTISVTMIRVWKATHGLMTSLECTQPETTSPKPNSQPDSFARDCETAIQLPLTLSALRRVPARNLPRILDRVSALHSIIAEQLLVGKRSTGFLLPIIFFALLPSRSGRRSGCSP